MKKVLISILVISVICLLAVFGFFSKYNYVTAKIAISRNELVKININIHPGYVEIEDTIGKKYGFKVINLEYHYFDKPINYYGIKIFNSCMKKAFIKKFGINKYLQYQSKLDSVCDAHIVK